MTAPTPQTPRAALVRDVLDALSATGAAVGAVEFINREALLPAQVAALAVVERNLHAALVALDALASGLGIQLNPTKTADRGEDAGEDRGRGHGEG